MCIELRSIDADEFRFAAYRHTARAAHTGSIDHDGVERSLRRDVVFGGRQCDKLHHDGRTDSDTFIHLLAVDHFFDADSHDALFAHRAVVRHDNHLVGPLRQLILEDDQVFVTCRQHSDDFVAGFLQSLSDRQHRSGSNTTARTYDRPVLLDTSGAS